MSYYSDEGATAEDGQGNNITSYITKIVQKYNADTSSWDTIAEINDPHVNPWDVPYISRQEGDKYKIIYNVKDVNNIAAESKTRLINITVPQPEPGGGLPVTTGTNSKLDGFVYKLTGSAWATMGSPDGSLHDIQNKQILIYDKLRINSRQGAAQINQTPHNAIDIMSEFDFGSWDGNTNTWTTEYQGHKNLIFSWARTYLYNVWDEMVGQAHIRNVPGFNAMKRSTWNQDYNVSGGTLNVPYFHDPALGTRMAYILWGPTHDSAGTFPSWMPVGGHNPNEQEFVIEGHPLPVAHSSIRVKGQGIRFFSEGYLSLSESTLWNNNTSGNPLEIGTSAFQDLGYNGQQTYRSIGTSVRPFSDIGGIESLNSYNEFIAASDNWLEQNVFGRSDTGDKSMQFVATVNLDEVQPDVWDYGIFNGTSWSPSSPVKTKLQTIPAGLEWYSYPYVWPTYTR